MMGKLVLALAAAGAMVATAMAAKQQDGGDRVPAALDWTLAPSSSPGKVQFGIAWRSGTSRGSNSHEIDTAELQGLAAAQLDAASATDVAFRLVRDAGRLDCDGAVRAGRGSGQCRFASDPGFAAELERRGLGRPGERQLFMLTLQKAELETLDELQRLGYARPGLDDYVAASIHGVGLPYLRGLAEAGYRGGTVDQLVTMRIHGVSPDFIRALNEAGFARRTPEQLVQMRIHGLSAEKMRGLAELGYRDVGHDRMLQMAIHGVTPAYIRSLAEAGYSGLSAEQLVQMKIHGVTADGARRANRALADAD